jgi:hypothetical protein
MRRVWFSATASRSPLRLACATLAGAILSLCAACGPQHPQIAPIPVHQIPVGINDAWHSVPTPEGFAKDCPAMIRTPQTSGRALAAFIAAAPVGCPVLALVEAPDVELVKQFAAVNPAAIELGNELELPPFELTPSQYGDWIGRAAVALAGVDYQGDVILGGVYALTNDTKAAIRFGLDSCVAAGLTRCVVGVHLYDASEADLQWLRDLNWRVWVTETGMSTRCDPTREREQAIFLAEQTDRFSTVPKLERVFFYQRVRGPSCSDLDTFGLTTLSQELLR